MADQWFYSSGGDRVGPLSSRELKDLADAGTVLPGDTVWKGGVVQGVTAHRVKHLFATPAPVALAATVLAVAAAPVVAVPAPEPVAAAPPAPAVERPAPPPPPRERKGRATAGPGVVLVSQDGSYVQFKKKCTTCAHEDTTRNRVKITSGVTRVSFFCPKCRKVRSGEVRGQMV